MIRFGVAVLALCSVHLSDVGIAQSQSDACATGFVWREAFPGDHVCVTPETRDKAAHDNAQADSNRDIDPNDETCRQGFVWREAYPGDRVCVPPATRYQVAVANSESHRSALRTGPNGPYFCLPGYVWRLAGPTDFSCVTPDQRDQAAYDNQVAASRRGSDLCKLGLVWREAGPTDLVCVTPETRAQTAADNAMADARRSPDAICRGYADAAVKAQNANLGLNAGGCPYRGDRWSSDWTGHFTWCLSADSGSRDRETAARESAIESCRHPNPWPGGGMPGGGALPRPGCCWIATPDPTGNIWPSLRCGATCPCGINACFR